MDYREPWKLYSTSKFAARWVGEDAPRQAVIAPAAGTKVPAARRELGPFTGFQLTTTPESIPASRSYSMSPPPALPWMRRPHSCTKTYEMP